MRKSKAVFNEFVAKKKRAIKMTSTAASKDDSTAAWDDEPANVSTDALKRLIYDATKARDEVENLRKQKSLAEEKYEKLEQMVINTLQAAGLKEFSVPGLGKYQLASRFSVHVPKDLESKQKLFGYIEKHCGPDVLLDFLTVHYQTLNGWFNAEAEAHGKNKKEFSVPGVGSPVEQVIAKFFTAKPSGESS